MKLFIVTRDRLSNLVALTSWGAAAGLEVVLVDNASSYPPLVQYLEAASVPVVRLRLNHGHKAPWTAGVVSRLATDADYLVTDPDVDPPRGASPEAVVRRMQEVLERHADVVKVGVGLRIDDLPRHYRMRDQVLAWESPHWADEIEPGVFRAPLDTTLALWRGGSSYCYGPSLRLGPPYVGRHLDWYLDSDHPDEELRYYRGRAARWVSHWGHEALGEEKLAVLEGRPHRRAWRWSEGLRRRWMSARIAADRALRR